MMKIIAQGLDLIDLDRIEKIWHEHPDRFLDRILTPAERKYCERKKFPLPHIAGRFAAKEAILKVLGTGWRGQIAWTDIEVLNDEAGQPHVTLTGYTGDLAARMGITRMLISITHTAQFAAASAIGVNE